MNFSYFFYEKFCQFKKRQYLCIAFEKTPAYKLINILTSS